MKHKTFCEIVVDSIIEDLQGRRGLGEEWDSIDSDVQEEIRQKWIQLARNET